MRGGLTDDPGPTPAPPEPTTARGTFQAASTAMAVLAALALFVSACGTGGTGARDEGPAHDEAVAGATASSSATPSALASPRLDRTTAVELLKSDPKVSAAVKRDLKPCVGDQYPVDLIYGNLTPGAADDVVINVVTCADLVGVGSYVYREVDGSYQNVFQAEEPPVYSDIDRGDLVVTKQVYEKGDPVSVPSSESVITYRWASGRFDAVYRKSTDYSKVVGGDPSSAPDS